MDGGGASKIALSIKSQDQDISYYRIFAHAKMLPLLREYCRKKNVEYSSVSFVCNGHHIKPTKTAVENGLESGDEIDVMVHQNGGGYSSSNLPN